VRSNITSNLFLKWQVFVLIASVGIFVVCFADEQRDEKPAHNKSNLNVNSLCYVCHLDLQTEEITTIHLTQGVTCDKCHGPSTRHMHDEMLMTKPDLLFGREEVDQMCNRCHQSHKNPQAVEAFRNKWFGRTRPNGRAITAESVCTDCHGTHNIVKQMGTRSQKEQPAEWVALFNGRNLDNWQSSGTASWTVRSGQLIATPGPNGQGGDLWTKTVYEDYLLAVTFRATWPIHAGIWLHTTGPDRGPRVEIFDPPEAGKPAAFTGSVVVPGKGLALANFREDLADRQGWNTISVKVRGDRIGVWLNGEEVGAVRTNGPAKGKIGLHLEGHPAYKTAELCVREVLLQQLDESAAKVSTLLRD